MAPAAPQPARLPVLEGFIQSEAMAINEAGRVAGSIFDPAPSVAVVWDGDGPPRPLPPLAGDSASQALGINDAGLVVGWSRGDDGVRMAVMWRPDGRIVALAPLPGRAASAAAAINEAGLAVGLNSTAVADDAAIATDTAVMWTVDGTPIELSRRPGDPDSEARAVNAAGTIVGWSEGARDAATDSTIKTAMRWSSDGSGTALPPLPGSRESLALAINAVGTIVGESVGGSPDVFTAVLWEADGQPRALAPPPGQTHGSARGITASGVVVGLTESHGILWSIDGPAIALVPLPGDTRSWANAINSAGIAVGVSRGNAGNRAVVWR